MNQCDFDLSSFEENKKYVYILECEDNKYYVGYTTNIFNRMKSHFSSNGGSKWTKKYKPIRIIDVSEGDLEDEEITTYVIMLRYGWKNVRGSYWSSVELKEPPIYVWAREEMLKNPGE